jgi:small nuclear ribonucleoprotein
MLDLHITTLGGYPMAEADRPLDALNHSRGKRVILDLKNGKRYVGTLKAFDIHINTVLDDAEEHQNGEMVRKIGTVFVRGDAVTVISPE